MSGAPMSTPSNLDHKELKPSAREHLLVGLMLVVSVLLVACGGAPESTTSLAAANAQDAPSEVEAPGPTADATDGEEDLLTLPTASGGQLVFNDLMGKPALLWFWAPW